MRFARGLEGCILVVGIAASIRPHVARAQPARLTREQADSLVRLARVHQQEGRFTNAQQLLDSALARCGATRDGSECRKIVASGKASLYQKEGVRARTRDTVFYAQSVQYWDRVLVEDSSNADALFAKAQVYQRVPQPSAVGPTSFYRDAAARDPSRKAAYLSFLGDYYMSNRSWRQAADAFREAVDANPDEEAARSGLIDALRRVGRAGVPELLARARAFELRDIESAADAYGAALSVSLGIEPPDSLAAEQACLGLVGVQSRSSRSIGAVPPGVLADWRPMHELREYLQSARVAAAPWWLATAARRTTLTRAALSRGGQAVSEGKNALAESLWISALELAPRESGTQLDLQRELSLLYFRRPELDPDQGKWKRLEEQLFQRKGAALESGDLEAAQRFHTALGLIYAARRQWRRQEFARNASDQLTWAMETVGRRRERERFHQPVPELRTMLAWGLDSAGYREEAGPVFGDAVAASLDLYNGAEADSLVQMAARAGIRTERLDRLLMLARFRSRLSDTLAQASELCTPQNMRVVNATGPADFVTRQRFKIYADCTTRVDTAARLLSGIRAFELADSGSLALIGRSDVDRLQGVMRIVLGAVGVGYRAAHLDRVLEAKSPAIVVTLAGEPKPRWLMLDTDEMVAGRVVAALGADTRGLRLRVTSGAVEVHASTAPLQAVVDRIRRVRGVVSVKVLAPAVS